MCSHLRLKRHVALAKCRLAAHKVYKELKRQLKEKQSDLSAEKIIELLQSIYQIEAITPNTKQTIKKTLLLTDDHKQLKQLFDFGCQFAEVGTGTAPKK